MIQKIKKPVSILLTVLMVFSVFAVVPFAASAAELAGYVSVQNLHVGDILGGDVQSLTNYGNYTLTLEANRYGDYFGKKTEATVTSSFDFTEAHGSDPVCIFDMNGYNRYYPYDENGNRCEAFIVTAVDHSAGTFSLAGYSEPDNPVLLNSSVKYRYCDGTAFHTGNTPAASTYKVDTGNRKWTNNSWYVVTENVTFEKRIEITGTVNLVLCDGATLTAKQGISVNNGERDPRGAGALNIYAQNGGTGALYAGTANGTSTTMKESPQRAAIGGDDNKTNGDITIHGGNIYAISNIGTAGIGGGQNSDGGNVTIYGGNVTAGNQNSYGSGIGGGYWANAGNINILGGTVTAFATGEENDAAFGTISTDRTVNLTIPEGATMVAGDNADSAVATTVDEYKANRKVYARVEAGKLPDYYTVDWKNDDGSILKTKEFVAGTTPTYDGENPTKAEGECCTYTFHGWNDSLRTYTGALPAVNEDTTYTAVFTDAPKEGYNKFTVGGHSVYSIVPLGDSVADGETKPYFFTENGTEYFRLTSLRNCKYNYYSADGANLGASFSKGVDGDYSVVVTSDSMPKIVLVKPVYTINWNNWDGTPAKMLGTDVMHGETPVYDGTEPTKPADDTNTYTFTGWTPALAPATDNATYTAKFDPTPKAHEHDGITFERWTSADSLPTVAGNYVLTSDVELSGTWNVPAGVTNLCLAGHTIRLSESRSGSVILLDDVSKNLTVYDDGTTGTITGGNTTGNGGGVNITEGTFTLKGGNIEGNVASNGGGVSVYGESSYFIMAGGTVRYNAGYTYTGGVLQIAGHFTMTGGTIQNNVGNVYGGVGIADAPWPSMSGNAVVKDNVIFGDDISADDTKITKTGSGYTIAPGGTPCDVRHATSNGLKINVIGAFESGAQIGIFNNNQTAAFTSGYGANNPDGAPEDFFFSDDKTYKVTLDENNEVLLDRKLISGHSLTLDGDIGINFYIDPSVAGMNAGSAIDSLTYTLEWENEGVAKKPLTVMGASISGESIIVTCKVCAAEMTCGVKASFSLGNKTENEVYSVRKYCDEGILAANAPYRDNEKLYNLANAMLDYGAKAQTVFKVKTDDLANKGLKYTVPEGTPDFDKAVSDANEGKNSNISEAQISGGSFKFATLVFLSDSTLRLYFENTGGLPTGSMTKWNDYYYMQKTDIPAKELDKLQEFTVNGTTLTYSALDYAKGLTSLGNVEYTALACALYYYNQAANEYFG